MKKNYLNIAYAGLSIVAILGTSGCGNTQQDFLKNTEGVWAIPPEFDVRTSVVGLGETIENFVETKGALKFAYDQKDNQLIALKDKSSTSTVSTSLVEKGGAVDVSKEILIFQPQGKYDAENYSQLMKVTAYEDFDIANYEKTIRKVSDEFRKNVEKYVPELEKDASDSFAGGRDIHNVLLDHPFWVAKYDEKIYASSVKLPGKPKEFTTTLRNISRDRQSINLALVSDKGDASPLTFVRKMPSDEIALVLSGGAVISKYEDNINTIKTIIKKIADDDKAFYESVIAKNPNFKRVMMYEATGKDPDVAQPISEAN